MATRCDVLARYDYVFTKQPALTSGASEMRSLFPY
jgi:hypothetical protein